jgi:hypothetical protein
MRCRYRRSSPPTHRGPLGGSRVRGGQARRVPPIRRIGTAVRVGLAVRGHGVSAWCPPVAALRVGVALRDAGARSVACSPSCQPGDAPQRGVHSAVEHEQAPTPWHNSVCFRLTPHPPRDSREHTHGAEATCSTCTRWYGHSRHRRSAHLCPRCLRQMAIQSDVRPTGPDDSWREACMCTSTRPSAGRWRHRVDERKGRESLYAADNDARPLCGRRRHHIGDRPANRTALAADRALGRAANGDGVGDLLPSRARCLRDPARGACSAPARTAYPSHDPAASATAQALAHHGEECRRGRPPRTGEVFVTWRRPGRLQLTFARGRASPTQRWAPRALGLDLPFWLKECQRWRQVQCLLRPYEPLRFWCHPRLMRLPQVLEVMEA